MITELLFLTVSAFSIPLLENSSHLQIDHNCHLAINEERHQKDIVLLFSSSPKAELKVQIYHRIPIPVPSSGMLEQLSFNPDTSYDNAQFSVSHELYKELKPDINIYSTTIDTTALATQRFSDHFRLGGYKTLLKVEGIAPSLAFIADRNQAEAFYKCANQPF
ncbi:hypothetical protein [Photobacterium lipolyticum]|uniref:Uncharacterized protein n=1 Tax=Photobacterium lipolyticum TaxID=266810 RepID=A0A2T3MZJ1_9GAMM|nr:hypothetical protein [Photobacterium lipolyticum]PSW05400.1 hypothetical protein C9I89_09070 [Photobacterium lipolyticum]